MSAVGAGGGIHLQPAHGGVLDRVVPATAVQDMPFAFRSAEHAHHAMDGPLGAYLRAEIVGTRCWSLLEAETGRLV